MNSIRAILCALALLAVTLPQAFSQSITTNPCYLSGSVTKCFKPVQGASLSAITQTTAGADTSARARLGSNTNDSAASGNIGELLTCNPGSNVTPASSGSFVTICTITPAIGGDFDVSATGAFAPSTFTTGAGNYINVAISLTAAASDAQASGGFAVFGSTVVNGNNTYIPTGTRRISVTASTPIYLVGRLTYAVDTGSLWTTDSFMQARRVR